MPRNIEIKASVQSVAEIHERLSRMTGSSPIEIEQDDTFFRCDSGRLKVRSCSDGTGELIFYRRVDADGPRASSYEIVPTDDAASLRNVLGLAFGQAGRVRKHRTVYMVGRTRVHVDQVDGLGSFMELEVVLSDGESEAIGVLEARRLMAALGIVDAALVDRAYVDLLNETVT